MKQNTPRSNTAPAAALPSENWQAIAEAASRFAAEWAHEVDEKGEAHSFWDEFLQIFNIRRRQFARHEARAKRSDNRRGFIDLFWPGKLLVEHKAGHKNKADDFDEALILVFAGAGPPEVVAATDPRLRALTWTRGAFTDRGGAAAQRLLGRGRER